MSTKPQEQDESPRPAFNDDLLEEIAAKADADRRSVLRRMVGLPVRGRSGKRIEAALAERGLLR